MPIALVIPTSAAVVKFALPAALMTPLICSKCLPAWALGRLRVVGGAAVDLADSHFPLPAPCLLSHPFSFSFAQICFQSRRRRCRHAKIKRNTLSALQTYLAKHFSFFALTCYVLDTLLEVGNIYQKNDCN